MFRCVTCVKREERVRSHLVLAWGAKMWGDLGFDSCSSYRAGWGLWMVPKMTSWVDVQPGLWFGKPSTLVPSAGAILAQRTMRQIDPSETSLPQSKFKAPACVGWESVWKTRSVYRSMAVKSFTHKNSDPWMCTLLCGFPEVLRCITLED